MKLKRQFFFRLGAVLLLIALGAVMMVIGRGHIIYFDNKTVLFEEKTIDSKYKIEVLVKGNELQKAYDRERVQAKITGQTLNVKLNVTDKKGQNSHEENFSIKIPYSLDAVVISLPMLLSAYPQESYMSEFVSLATPVTADEEKVVTDEFSMTEL